MSIIEKAVEKLGRPERPRARHADNELGPLEASAEMHDAHVGQSSSSTTVDQVAGLKDGSLNVEPLSSPENSVELTAPAERSREQIVREKSNPVLELDFVRLESLGFITPLVPRSKVADEFRTIKRPLLKNISRHDSSVDYPNLIMVTSALKGDGKTFNSINLALSIATEQDKTVLFVDADVVKGAAGRLLGVEKGCRGLVDLLNDPKLDPREVILSTNIPKLKVLPSGIPDDHATELLASETMHELMIEMATRYSDRVLVFDSPPLLLTTESSVLASFMGQIVFVASADLTPQPAVNSALQRIGDDKIIGLVMNRASERRTGLFGIGVDYGYGYGYGYGGYGYGHERDDEADVAARADAG